MMNHARRTHGDRGSVLPLVALGLVMMLVMAAFAIDLGSARQAKAQVQSTTDASALAGAQSLSLTGTGPGGVKKAVYDAADWAFRNLNMTVPSPTSCGTDKTCYSPGDSNNTVVEITTPYTPTRLPTDSYSTSDFIHVKTCWNNGTYIATVIGISSIRVCSEATARMVGTFVPNTDLQDETGDPFAMCTSNPSTRLLDVANWFPSQSVAKDIPGHNNFGGTYLYASDSALGNPVTDPTAVKFVIASDTAFKINNGSFPDASTVSTVHIFDETSPFVTAVFKSQDAQNRYKWEMKFTNFTTVDANGKGGSAKNFKDTLPDGQYSFSIYVRAANGDCDQETWTVIINKAKGAVTGVCQEDLFRGGTNPPSATKVGPGTAYPSVTATYYDETPPWRPSVSPYASDSTKWGTDLQFSITGPDPTIGSNYGKEKTWYVMKDGKPGDTTGLVGQAFVMSGPPYGSVLGDGTGMRNGNGQGEYKYIQRYQFTLPTNLINGQKYTLQIQSYDSDQNKAGGDCGFAKWTINYTNGKGSIVLWD